MKLKQSPVQWNPHAAAHFPANTKSDTELEYVSEDAIKIDGEVYEFEAGADCPNIAEITKGLILDAHRVGGELHLTIRRFYTQDWQSWYSEEYKTFPEVKV